MFNKIPEKELNKLETQYSMKFSKLLGKDIKVSVFDNKKNLTVSTLEILTTTNGHFLFGRLFEIFHKFVHEFDLKKHLVPLFSSIVIIPPESIEKEELKNLKKEEFLKKQKQKEQGNKKEEKENNKEEQGNDKEEQENNKEEQGNNKEEQENKKEKQENNKEEKENNKEKQENNKEEKENNKEEHEKEKEEKKKEKDFRIANLKTKRQRNNKPKTSIHFEGSIENLFEFNQTIIKLKEGVLKIYLAFENGIISLPKKRVFQRMLMLSLKLLPGFSNFINNSCLSRSQQTLDRLFDQSISDPKYKKYNKTKIELELDLDSFLRMGNKYEIYNCFERVCANNGFESFTSVVAAFQFAIEVGNVDPLILQKMIKKVVIGNIPFSKIDKQIWIDSTNTLYCRSSFLSSVGILKYYEIYPILQQLNNLYLLNQKRLSLGQDLDKQFLNAKVDFLRDVTNSCIIRDFGCLKYLQYIFSYPSEKDPLFSLSNYDQKMYLKGAKSYLKHYVNNLEKNKQIPEFTISALPIVKINKRGTKTERLMIITNKSIHTSNYNYKSKKHKSKSVHRLPHVYYDFIYTGKLVSENTNQSKILKINDYAIRYITTQRIAPLSQKIKKVLKNIDQEKTLSLYEKLAQIQFKDWKHKLNDCLIPQAKYYTVSNCFYLMSKFFIKIQSNNNNNEKSNDDDNNDNNNDNNNKNNNRNNNNNNNNNGKNQNKFMLKIGQYKNINIIHLLLLIAENFNNKTENILIKLVGGNNFKPPIILKQLFYLLKKKKQLDFTYPRKVSLIKFLKLTLQKIRKYKRENENKKNYKPIYFKFPKPQPIKVSKLILRIYNSLLQYKKIESKRKKTEKKIKKKLFKKSNGNGNKNENEKENDRKSRNLSNSDENSNSDSDSGSGSGSGSGSDSSSDLEYNSDIEFNLNSDDIDDEFLKMKNNNADLEQFDEQLLFLKKFNKKKNNNNTQNEQITLNSTFSEINIKGLKKLPNVFKILKVIHKAIENIDQLLEFPEPNKIDMEIVIKQLALSIGKLDLPPLRLSDIGEEFIIPEFEDEGKQNFTQVFKPAKRPLYQELTFSPLIKNEEIKQYPKLSKKNTFKYYTLQIAWMMRGINLSYNAPIVISPVYEHDVYYKKTTAGGLANKLGLRKKKQKLK
ncbi:n-acetyltransferase eco [Anaeramoeba flamelloides]|uniref:N-acetyltransferase eco n=1 Tax=Anaeramoeba flamelloides TaxID=1746091 RepID=A0AAV7ZLS2_9EUKA|nr:n-acetyltransferase eco [Anaeramoeba flamelloides]